MEPNVDAVLDPLAFVLALRCILRFLSSVFDPVHEPLLCLNDLRKSIASVFGRFK